MANFVECFRKIEQKSRLHIISIVAHDHMITIGSHDNTSTTTSSNGTVVRVYILIIGTCDNTKTYVPSKYYIV